MADRTNLFSGRDSNYSRFRPNYPRGIYALLQEHAGLTADSVIADIGSGTGKLAALFLERGNYVHCVEPNADMRRRAESDLSALGNFAFVDGTAEMTTLSGRSVDLVTAGQAFHWFNPPRAAEEFLRILRPGGMAALIWNNRRENATGMNIEYERICKEFSPSYHSSGSLSIPAERIASFFGGTMQEFTLDNEQLLDLEGIMGRYMSASYAIGPENPQFSEVMNSLEDAFRKHESGGYVSLQYSTKVFLGIPVLQQE